MGIVTSFLVGGLLLLTMLQFNNQVMQNTSQTTLDVNSKKHMETVRKIITHDINRIGFGENNKINAFNPPHFINFKANIYGSGTKTVKWQFKENKKVKDTANPDDRVLMRVGPVSKSNGNKPTRYNVVDFSITGYSDIYGNTETTDKDQIKSLLIKIVYEAPESMSKDDNYPRTVWQKHIVPNNLQFDQPQN
ncbi:hypothetical protein [Fodinibius salinus]|nr:hypothetical protein [Fodinibius salinus]